jgi:hypothetical protein
MGGGGEDSCMETLVQWRGCFSGGLLPLLRLMDLMHMIYLMFDLSVSE